MKKTMRHVLAMMLVCMLMISVIPENASAAEDNTLVVASTTKMSGNFFTDMWGSNTSDIDVRMLLHGYNLVKWDPEFAAYGVDDSVVDTVVVTQNSKGDRTFHLYLNEDMYYSDGTQITAKDYAFTFLLQSASEMRQLGAAIHTADYIVGLDEYINDKTNEISGIVLEGDFGLAVTFKSEYLPYYYELALLRANPYPIHELLPGCEVANGAKGVYIRDAVTKRAAKINVDVLEYVIYNTEDGYLSYPEVVSGPYKLVSYDKAKGVAEFEINEYYKGNQAGQKPSIEKIIFRHVTNAEAIEKLEKGEIDLLNKLMNVEQLDKGLDLVADENFAVSNYPREGFGFISFNCETPIVSEAAVRQAVAYCFDKNEFVTDYLRNYGVRTDGYYGIGQWIYQMVEGVIDPPIAVPGEGATEEELNNYAEEVAKWEKLTLDNIKRYELDIAKANELLDEAGWTKNIAGTDYRPGTDNYRYKATETKFMQLELDMIYPEGNEAAEYVAEKLTENLKQAGIKLNAKAVEFTELLKEYYRQKSERTSDMIYLATNFAEVFDPSETFSLEDAEIGDTNRTGIADEKLYALAADMVHTHPSDMLTYLEKWVAFQEYWTEVLPAMPLYSNIYFDFYTADLEEYNINGNSSWASAIVGAHLKDAE